ncbi:uncharacterized protein LOC127234073 [Phodopus roborovskii]|uniref:uncharacterized protein LOC127234073 n=1 Tax=Phodopus roborovskii TaxID=109678 RepID=UPI0021E464CE|nr:uncharacterized protein LOC127234073 [Phodopus roborovskii]
MALGLSLQLCRSLSRRKRLPHRSEAARRGAEPAAAAAVREAATAAERRVGPRAVPPRRAPCAQARRPAGDPCGGRSREAGRRRRGDQEEEQERVKERRRSGRRGRRRAGPARPCPAQPRWRPRPTGPPNPRLPLHLRPRCGAEARLRGARARRSLCCSRLAFSPRSCEPAACSDGRRASSDLQLRIFFFPPLRARGNLGSTPCRSGRLFSCKLGFREGRGAESQCGTRDLPAPSGQP